MSQIKKKWIGNKQVDGNKILLDNAQPLKVKLQNGTEVDLFQLNASDEVEVLKAPRALAEGSESNSLQTKNQVDAAISVVQSALTTEVGDRQAGDSALQTQINNIISGFDFKYGAIAATADAGLAAAVDGDPLAPLLPFSDDEGTTLTISDFSDGDYILSKNGASSKAWKVYDDAGTLKVTDQGFVQMADGHGYLVKYDLPDSPATQETNAIYKFNGVDLVKIGDFDWSLADGIDISPAYAAMSGIHAAIVAGDSVQTAIHKLESSMSLVRQAIQDLETNSSGDISTLEGRIQDVEDLQDSYLKLDGSRLMQNTLEFSGVQEQAHVETLTLTNKGFSGGSYSASVNLTRSGYFSQQYNTNPADSSIANAIAELVQQINDDIVLGGTGIVAVDNFDGSMTITSPQFQLDFTTGSANGEAWTQAMSSSYIPAQATAYKIRNIANGELANDAVTKSQLDAVESRVSDVETDINAAGTGLKDVSADHESRLSQAETDIDNVEVTVGQHSTDISTLQGSVGNAETDIDNLEFFQSTIEGQNLDGRLGTLESQNLDGRISDNDNDIFNLGNDIGNNSAAISTLQGEMTTAQGEISGLQFFKSEIESQDLNNRLATVEGQDLDGRVTTLENQDLNNRLSQAEIDIDNLEAGTTGAIVENKKMIVTISAQDITNGYIDLSHLVMSESVNASVDRIPLYEGASEDYTISQSGNVSRMTFLNALVSPSESALEVGDKIYIQFMFKPSEQV